MAVSPIDWETWVGHWQSVWALWRETLSFVGNESQFLVHQAYSLVTTLTFPLFFLNFEHSTRLTTLFQGKCFLISIVHYSCISSTIVLQKFCSFPCVSTPSAAGCLWPASKIRVCMFKIEFFLHCLEVKIDSVEEKWEEQEENITSVKMEKVFSGVHRFCRHLKNDLKILGTRKVT